MPVLSTNKIVGILGSKGAGKSTMAEALFMKRERAVVYDTMGEYDVGFCVTERLAFIQYLRRNEKFRIAYLPIEPQDFPWICRAVREKGNLLFLIEEVGQYCSPNFTDEEFSKCVTLGRHAKLDIVYTTQRIADVSRRLTSQTDMFYCFRLTEPRDLDTLAQRFGDVMAIKVSGLPALHYIKLKAGTKYESDNVIDVRIVGRSARMVHNHAVAHVPIKTSGSGTNEQVHDLD
jgi:hypothetical protein